MSVVNQLDLAGLLGLTPRQVRRLEDSDFEGGVPFVMNGKAKGYPVPAAVQWYVRYKANEAARRIAPGDFEEARTRKIAAEAALAEFDLAEREGTMIRVEDLDAILGPPLSALRAKLLSLPGKLSQSLPSCRNRAEIRAHLDDVVVELMEELGGLGEPSIVA